jgi:hypothetical protein
MFKVVLQTVLGFLGIQAFAKSHDGKFVMTSDQEQKIKEKYGDIFIAEFKKDLESFDGKIEAVVDDPQQTAADAKALREAQAKINALELEKKNFESKIETLSKEPVQETVQAVETEKYGKTMFKPDMKLGINRVIEAQFFGRPDASAISGDTTITTEELQTEFGRYVSAQKMDIFRALLGTTSSLDYMSTMITDKFEVRASQANITSVLQSFVPQWTAKGASSFTPLTIKQFVMKLNVPIIPSDIIEDVLGYLYDEKLEPKDMPIVRYIVEQLIKPKLEEERELAFAKGRYIEPVKDANGNFTASAALAVCDGYLTQLCDLKAAADTKIHWLLPAVASLGTGATLLANIEAAVDAVTPEYKGKKLTIHADPDIVLNYARAYRDKYPNTKNEDGKKITVDYTNFTFAELEGMRGTGAFFITPKENFRHLMSRDPKTMQLRMATQDYEVKTYGEWREGVGFWIKEAIFAYLPTALVTLLSPAGSTGSTAGSTGSTGGL